MHCNRPRAPRSATLPSDTTATNSPEQAPPGLDSNTNLKMKKKLCILTACALGSAVPLLAQESSSDSGSTWRFKVGVNYVSGLSDLMDAYESIGYESDFEWPIGIDFSAGQNFSNGLGWDVNIGPVAAILGDVEAVLVPVGVAGRYSFNAGGDTVPYVRAGVEYLFATGDYLNDGDFGFVGGIGIEFNADGSVGWGFEARYDSTEIEFTRGWGWDGDEYVSMRQDIQPYEFVLGAFMTF